MLEISNEQFELLGQSKLEHFFVLAEEYIDENFQDWQIKGAARRAWIMKTYHEAREFGIVTIRQHFKYINYKCLFGDEFYKTMEGAQSLLNQPINTDRKLTLLKELARGSI